MSAHSINCGPTAFREQPAQSDWASIDYDVLQTLAIRLRVMAVSQATTLWSPNDMASMRARIQHLSAAGLLDCFSVNVHPLLSPEKPLYSWAAGAAAPNSVEISRIAKARWTQPSQPTEVFVASRKTANLFGADPHRLSKVEERDHDLLLADAFVAHRRQQRSPEPHWIGENYLPKAGYQIKDPDAFLINDSGKPFAVIESAGRYSGKQVQDFHDYCEAHSLSYELW